MSRKFPPMLNYEDIVGPRHQQDPVAVKAVPVQFVTLLE